MSQKMLWQTYPTNLENCLLHHAQQNESELSNSAAAASSSSANSATDSEMLDITSATAALVPSPPSDINQNNFSESSSAAASSMEVVHGESNILAPVSASGSIPRGETVTATTNQVASAGVASLPQQDIPSFLVDYVNDRSLLQGIPLG